MAALICALLPVYAGRARGRQYAVFGGVVSLIAFPAAALLAVRLQGLLGAAAGWFFAYAFVASGVHAMRLVRARLRRRTYRYAVSLPGMALQALGALSLLYFAAMLPLRGLLYLLGETAALDVLLWLDLLPVLMVLAGVVGSLRLRREVVRFDVGAKTGPAQLSRLPVQRRRGRPPAPSSLPASSSSSPQAERPLRIVQITDPHLGPWQPVHRLQRRIRKLLAYRPDLVLLTGDYLTMEGNGSPGSLAEALRPLRAYAGRCFACLGNHDHEALEEVHAAMAANGIPLLVDDATEVETEAGPVQILGADFHYKGRPELLKDLFVRHPRAPGRLRLLLLHDPSHFRDVPKGEVDLALSGHTHGGQVGLVSLGLNWTVLANTRWPDHGLFGYGAGRLYVHRGTGFYGFPLRIGVPGEASLLELLLPHGGAASSSVAASG